jgi:tripartite-type tricarboxylate transporter receptor subunit TctC
MALRGYGCERLIMVIAVLLLSASAAAQSYPTNLIRIVVPFPAGGGIDSVTRILSPKLNERFGQPIVIDNRTGAGGDIGTEMVAKAAPNGYTLLATFSSLATNAALYTRQGFDTVRDLAPVTLIATVPNVIVVNPTLPVKTVKDLIQLAKKRPGEILYASIGPGTPAHLSAELFDTMAGIKMTHVAYKGGPQSLIALISGESHLTFTTAVITLPHIKTGKLRVIAVTSLKRFSLMPEVPTVDESGLPGYESTAWYALLAPAKTPQPIIDELQREVAKALRLNDVKESLLQQGAEPVGSSPEQLAALIKNDIAKWSKVVKATGAKVE